MGWITPEETTDMIRPNLRSIMPGSVRSAMRTRPTNIMSQYCRHMSDETPAAGPGGGPPLLRTRMSRPPPSASSAPAWTLSICAMSPVSSAKPMAPCPMEAAASPASSGLRPVSATRAPCSANILAMP